MAGRTEQRKAPRIQPYLAPCRLVHSGRRLAGYVVELGPLGARVSCDDQPPALGEAVVLEVRFSRQAVFSPLPAEIKWSRPPDESGGAHLVGLTFRGVSAEQQRTLDRVLDEFRRRAALLA
jgi:PilZ domain-containing protein